MSGGVEIDADRLGLQQRREILRPRDDERRQRAFGVAEPGQPVGDLLRAEAQLAFGIRQNERHFLGMKLGVQGYGDQAGAPDAVHRQQQFRAVLHGDADVGAGLQAVPARASSPRSAPPGPRRRRS